MAITVKRSMLNAKKYKWAAGDGDNPKDVKHDRIMFSRREGYEVIPMIQQVVNHFGYETEDDVKRIETVIATQLPGNVRSRKNVFNWLTTYFSQN